MEREITALLFIEHHSISSFLASSLVPARPKRGFSLLFVFYQVSFTRLAG